MSYENTVIKERLKNLRAKMQENGIDYYMMPTSDFHNSEYSADFFKVREYFCGFDGSNGTLVVSKDHAGMWTDGRYFIQAENQMKGTGVELFKMMNPGVPTIEEFLEKNMKDGESLGFDGRVISTSIGEKLEKKLSHKNVTFKIEKDLAEEVWTDRPELPCHDMYVLSDELCGKSFAEKLADLRKAMSEYGTTSHLLSKLDDIMWLTNLRGNDVECNPVALSYAYVTDSEFVLFVQAKEVTPEVKAYCDRVGIVLKDYHELTAFLTDIKFFGDVLYDKRNTNFLTYKALVNKAKEAGVELKNQKNPTELMKAIKNETELKNIREVYLKDSAKLTEFIYWVKKNVGKIPMTEYSAAMKLDGMRAEIPGFIELSFPTISAYNANAAMAHYEATEDNCAEVKAEGMLLVDSGATYTGGTTDVTRTIVVGEISGEIKKHYTATVAGMLQLAGARFMEGCTGRNVDIFARQPLWDMDIDYNHGTGHGIGYMLNVHEGPQNIRWRFAPGMEEALLQPGMIVSDEPGVYIEGSHGIRIENIVEVVKRNENEYGKFYGFDHLTYVPIDLEAIDTAYMKPENVKALNDYHARVYEKLLPLIEDQEVREWLKEATRPIN
ncbi:aminopeptidase P family protein [Butyrivibrio sp. DSM 10294]|uniref:aminopeptidase P family protein n=1 Tax=Butyrivibrio sp. DSM 10294 TaxID=2972457 RepID=UPI00234F0550|nr:aminopeptidase P family protein [Butyrivibrio sp. DSM 10294]MDC7294070.1 aminopeptidase P family protein [Butyrivibrio sp. DSM 10294]